MKYILFAFGFALISTAQVLPDHYIVDLSTEPVARVAARQHKRINRADAELTAQRTRIGAEQRRIRQLIEQGGAQVLDQFHTVRNALVVKMSAAEAEQVRRMAGVRHVHAVRLYKPLLDHSLPLQKVVDAWQQIGGMDKAGLGIKIAIIDTGIDASHPAFQDASLPVPDGFPIVNRDTDRAYTNNKIIVARAYDDPKTSKPYSARDVEGHGTGVAMTAAGVTNAGHYGPITGVAPKAWLGSYKVFPDGGDGAPDSLIIRAIEDAVNDGMDVLNLSLGAFPALRTADDDLVTAVENAAAAGKVVVVAAGNDGSVPNTIGSPGSAPSAIAVGSSANDRIFAGKVQVDGHAPYTAFPGDGANAKAPVSGQLVDVSQFDPSGLACDTLPSGSLAGATVLILRGTCTFETKLQDAQAAGAKAAVIYTDAARPDPITPAVGAATMPVVMLSNADGLDLKTQLAANPSLTVTVDFRLFAAASNPARLSDFSSKGPNSDLGIKPDLLAVGGNIYTATPVSGNGSGYVVESGTSFSSPTVAGAAALLLAARPGLTAQQYRSLLVNSTSAFPTDSAVPLPVQSAGTGLLNMTSSLASTITAAPVSLSFGAGGGTVDQRSTVTLTNIGTTGDTFSITAVPQGDGPAPAVSINTVQLNPGASRTIALEFVGTGLAPGAYQGYLVVQGTQSQTATRIPYWYGVPSQTAQYLQILKSPTDAPAGSRQTIFFRFLDAAGLPVTDGIDASVISGARVVNFDSDDQDIPGAFLTDVRMPRTPGPTVIHIEFNGIGQDVTIKVN
jgi:minor extracellular serine protease Vpr